MEIMELRSEKTGEINEDFFARKVANTSHTVVMLHFIE